MVEKSQEQNKENESAADGAAAASTDKQRFEPKKGLCVVCCIDILFYALSQKGPYRAIYCFSSPKVKITAAGDSDVRHFKLCFVHHQSRRVFMKNVLVKVCWLWYLQN